MKVSPPNLAGLASALLGLWPSAGAEPPTATPAPPKPAPLEIVFDVRRRPDVDLVLLNDGRRQTGLLRNEIFQLQTPEADLTFPANQVAGVELADGRGSLDILVTVHQDRFSGFLRATSIRLATEPSEPDTELRPQQVHKLILRRRPAEAQGPMASARVLLRRGDFFAGTLVDDRFRLAGSDTELRWSSGEIASVSFLRAGEAIPRLVLSDGRAHDAGPMAETVELQCSVGPRLPLYRGWIETIEQAGVLPETLARRIGAVSGGPEPALNSALPDPAVRVVKGMVWVPPGEFLMGSPDGEADRDLDEGPQTKVVIPAGFWIGQCEVTQAEFETLTGGSQSLHSGKPSHPVERVTWQEAMDYCRRLTDRERQAGHLPDTHAYRLPTEAEWEYACRAGTTTRFSHGDDPGEARVGDCAWFDQNSGSATQPVGRKSPNAWNLFDMHGNVLEWCLDPWRGALPGATLTNQPTLAQGMLRVARGGSWLYAARRCRSANRDSYGALNRCSDLGFRIVLARDAAPPSP